MNPRRHAPISEWQSSLLGADRGLSSMPAAGKFPPARGAPPLFHFPKAARPTQRNRLQPFPRTFRQVLGKWRLPLGACTRTQPALPMWTCSWAYFASQRAGDTLHSNRKNCLPGDGWFSNSIGRAGSQCPGRRPRFEPMNTWSPRIRSADWCSTGTRRTIVWRPKRVLGQVLPGGRRPSVTNRSGRFPHSSHNAARLTARVWESARQRRLLSAVCWRGNTPQLAVVISPQ